MIRIFVFSLFIAFHSIFNAQVLDEYPKKQYFYQGGLANFYKEAHDYLVNNKLQECNSNEIYQPRFIVSIDGSIKLVKDSDTLDIAKNKCAHDLSLEVMKNLKNWKPAEVKGMKIASLAEFIFYPKDLMSNYKEGYIAEKFIIGAQYPKGNIALEKDFHDEFMSLFADYQINGKFNLEFYVNKEGHISSPRIYPSVYDKKFNVDFLRTLSRLKKTWKPSLYSDMPIKQKIIYPMNFSTNFYDK